MPLPAATSVVLCHSEEMKGLRIDIDHSPIPKVSSKIKNFIGLVILVLVGLLVLPLILFLMIFGMIINLFSFRKANLNINEWKEITTGEQLKIKYRFVNVDDLPDYLHQYFDTQPLIEFFTDPEIEFLNGFFTDFTVERTDGIFIQKVICNSDAEEVISLPLYFFKYETNEVEEIKDLKDYEIDFKGNPNDFMISAIGNDGELQIRLRKE